jgi:hypothetical protein
MTGNPSSAGFAYSGRPLAIWSDRSADESSANLEAGWDLLPDEVFPPRRRNLAALTVLLISIVMVIGPTPPGTGVSAPAVFTASG